MKRGIHEAMMLLHLTVSYIYPSEYEDWGIYHTHHPNLLNPYPFIKKFPSTLRP